ncbi:DUF1778 domain-containing protein [Demequina capsici]|uniref:DUF1778 domain-containing protein n=1 Tax=Demequina capsici TaxID=3075620 RepID=A0AA96F873_9MICO|nr:MULTISPECIES: DUF1778 domain-containing protein [unclassified Demequina]WNM25896.1 DUF1778 domain-containing protein [Demequina sp. OYTSA14]WNM28792.1 DUF1778 domain-containing protein [Demequina sp. PMTSA13]
MATPTRDEYLQMRITADAKDHLREAARASEQDLSTFVLQAAKKAADEVLAERWTFRLSDEDYDSFLAQLEEPARTLPGLAALASEPSPFSDR